jgi:hypothetical protein
MHHYKINFIYIVFHQYYQLAPQAYIYHFHEYHNPLPRFSIIKIIHNRHVSKDNNQSQKIKYS